MAWFAAFAIGYFVGSRAGRERFVEVTQAFQAVRESEEVADLVRAARGHLGHALRELADVVDTGTGRIEVEGDLVDRVRSLFGRDPS